MSLKISQPDIKRFIELLQQYEQGEMPGCEWSAETVSNDIVYLLGVAIDPNEYGYAQGYDKFKSAFLAALNSSQETGA